MPEARAPLSTSSQSDAWTGCPFARTGRNRSAAPTSPALSARMRKEARRSAVPRQPQSIHRSSPLSPLRPIRAQQSWTHPGRSGAVAAALHFLHFVPFRQEPVFARGAGRDLFSSPLPPLRPTIRRPSSGSPPAPQPWQPRAWPRRSGRRHHPAIIVAPLHIAVRFRAFRSSGRVRAASRGTPA